MERGDKVAVNFYNVDSTRQEGHSLTIGDPYKVDIDIAFAENGDITLTANNQTTNQYYSKSINHYSLGRYWRYLNEVRIHNFIDCSYFRSR